MFYEINKKFTAMLLVLFLINISAVFVKAENDDILIFETFRACSPFSKFVYKEMFTDYETSEMHSWREIEIVPEITLENGQQKLAGAYILNKNKGQADEKINGMNLELLFNQKSLYEYLEKNKISDIKEIKIIYAPVFRSGYIVLIKTEGEIYFMTVLNNGDKYSGFEHEKIYSFDEFKKLCEPQPCTVTIFNEPIECDQPPIMEYGITYLPLRACFEYLGFTVEWDQETKTATCYNDNDTYTYVADNTLNPYGYLSKNGKNITYSVGFRMVNGRILVYDLFVSLLVSEFDVWFINNYDTHEVTVIHQSCDDDFCKKYRN